VLKYDADEMAGDGRLLALKGQLVVLRAIGAAVVLGLIAVVLAGAAQAASTVGATSLSATTTPSTPSTGSSGSTPAVSSLPASQCPPVSGPRWIYPGKMSVTSDLYESYALDYSCSDAKTWTQKLAGLTLADRTAGDPNPITGPAGFTCYGFADKDGHAYAGGCRQGATRVEFGWNWNVLNLTSTEVDVLGVSEAVQIKAQDADFVLKTLSPGHYELDVRNTSGIGTINTFSWDPPSGWTVTQVTKSVGSECRLTGGGLITCTGSVAAPKCLCTPSGGTVTITFTASTGNEPTTLNGHPVTYGAEGASIAVTAMTAIPYIIPQSPQEEKSQSGV
jgi:hypothetical protein